MRSRFASGNPYTASAASSGEACFTLYHFSQVAMSFSLKSAEKSTTRAPPSSSARAWLMATPLGVAKKTQSQPLSGAEAGSVKARS